MRKNYNAPQIDVVQFSSELMQMHVIHHSGGGGFDENQIY